MLTLSKSNVCALFKKLLLEFGPENEIIDALSKNHICLKNDSEIMFKAFPYGPRALDELKGQWWDLVVLDEVAFSNYSDHILDYFLKMDYPLFILSTKHKPDDVFYKLYVESKHPKLNENNIK